MTLAQDLSSQFKARILPALPSSIRGMIGDGSRRHLIARVNQRLMLFNNTLISLETGQRVQLDGQDQNLPIKELARAARSLIVSSETPPAIMLYLPPAEFVATSVNMPGLDRELLLSALQLQVDNLFPSYNEKLVVTLGTEAIDPLDTSIALWFPEHIMTTLFEEFASHELFLSAIAPRAVIDNTAPAIVDIDHRGGTLVQFERGAVTDWLHINHLDLQEEGLNQQWIATLENLQSSANTLNSPESYTKFKAATLSQDYAFIPSGALNARKREEKGRNLTFAAAAVVVLMVVAYIPFLLQSIQFRSLASTLADYRAQSVAARADQAVVVNYENEWGVITDFPDQDVQEAMFALQTILQPDQLASLELTEGLIKIQGSSAEPQAILQRLEQDPMFTEVVFSRATNNSRYYIDLRLSTVNFEGYMVRYFPDE